jgi:catechol 2,3-dioxygenase-like lactoylglutathione lyase family enzyme
MQIKITAIPVDDQDKALNFYTNKLGFTKKADIHIGPLRWLTVSSPEGPEGVELVLQTMDFPPSRIYQKARFDADIPAVAFISSDVHAEYARLKERGIKFRGAPQNLGPITAVVFEDGCGNLVNLVQPAG